MTDITVIWYLNDCCRGHLVINAFVFVWGFDNQWLELFFEVTCLAKGKSFWRVGWFWCLSKFYTVIVYLGWWPNTHHSRRCKTSWSNANIARRFNSWGSIVFIAKILLLKVGHWILHALKWIGNRGYKPPTWLMIYLCGLLPRFLSSGSLNQGSLYPEIGFKFPTKISCLLCGKRISSSA